MTKWQDYLEDVTAFSLSQAEPAWLQEMRINALGKIDELPLPAIERVRFNRWPLFTVSLEDQVSDSVSFPIFDELDDKPLILQQGTVTALEQLPQKLIEQGVILTDIFSAAQEYPELLQQYFMNKAVAPDEDKLTALHTAFFNSGIFLYVPKDVVIEDPIEAVFIQDGSLDQHFFKHVVIVAEDNSQFSYIERFQTQGEDAKAASANIVVEVIAKPGAKVKFSSVDTLGENLTTYMNRRGYIMKDAAIDWAMGVMNDGDIIADFDSDLVGDGGHSEVKIVAIGSGRQTQAIDTRVTNKAPHTVGHILQHGVIRDRATLTFNGIGHILKGARGSDAQQESRVLMLSDKARGDANPILLIDENDVTAGHAASIGRIDPEEMFYLMSRGLHQEEAERLVIRGFLGSVITAIPSKEVQTKLIATIEGKLDA